ncbi:MAG: nuclear transport factor 2 family protein [Proteobacteria bacterium]|nr:nuclear transport factor 2 family protein [Pseudomonadota bacterium]
MRPKDIVMAYWSAMQTNDFASAAEWLSEDIVIHWPQSRERVRGRRNITTINSTYPSEGRWRFTLDRILADGNEVVTDISLTDGKTEARALSFHVVRDGLIVGLTEYWPDTYHPPDWRAALVERY